jgi:hypothetical protein
MEREDRQREAENDERARLTYSTPDPNDLEEDYDNLTGVPWGGISMKYVMNAGKAREKLSSQSSAAESSPNLGQGRGPSLR